MKTSQLSVMVLAILLTVLPRAAHSRDAAQTPSPANETSPTFSLTLSSRSPEYRIGTDMWIRILQTNLTNHAIDCTEEWDGIDRAYLYEAKDQDGKAAEKRHRGNAGFDVHACTMAKGEHATREILINRVFKFDQPGKYTLRVGRREPDLTDEKGEPLVVWSNPITITITG